MFYSKIKKVVIYLIQALGQSRYQCSKTTCDLAINQAEGAITFCQTHSYLTSCTAHLPSCQYQVILHVHRGTCLNNLSKVLT